MASSDRLGQLRYKIRYDTTIGKLHVTVAECKDLPKADILGKIDPYVKVFLMPGNHADLKTKVIKKNFNPVFNDEFSFVIDVENAQKKTIVFQVFDKDLISKDDAIGECQVPLWLVDMSIVTDKNESLEKPTTDKNKKPVLKLKRPNATTRSSSMASLSSSGASVRESSFDVSGGHRHSTASSIYGGQGYHNSNTGGQGFHNASNGGQGFHNASNGGQGFHNTATEGGQGFHNSATDGGQGFHTGGGQGYHDSTVVGGQGFHNAGGQGFHRQEFHRQEFHRQEFHTSEVSQTMSLQMLNERLEQYIRGIQLTPEGNPVSINVVTNHDSVGQDIEALHEYQQWEAIIKEYEDEARVLAELKAEIGELEINNAYIRDGNNQLDEFILSVDGKIRIELDAITILEKRLIEIQMERERLERIRIESENKLVNMFGKVDIVPTGWVKDNIQISMNAVRASINDEQRKFIMDVNGKDWVEEETSTSFDKSKIMMEIKAEYDRRLEEELSKLHAEYTKFYSEFKVTAFYKDRIAALNAKLGELTPDEQREIAEIMRNLKADKEKIKQLEIKKLELTQEERTLTEGLEEAEVDWRAKIEEKKKEIEFLEQELSFLSIRYEEFSKSGASYSAEEVKRYSDLIQGAHVVGVKKHAKIFLDGEEAKIIEGVQGQQEESSSSDSEEDLDDPYPQQ